MLSPQPVVNCPRDSKWCSLSLANPFGNCLMDSKYCSPKSSSALESYSLDFNNFSTSKANPLDSCPLDFKYRAPEKPIHWAVAQWIARRLVYQTFDTGSPAHKCCMYKRTALYILSRKYKNEIRWEIHHLVNAHTIDSASDASRTMRPQ
jgi:hypothetical protein